MDSRRTVAGPGDHRDRNRSAALRDLCFTVADLSGMKSPSNQQIGGIEDLRRSVSNTWGHRRSNRLATLLGSRRPVGPVGVRSCPKEPQQIGGIEVLCLTVKAPWERGGRNSLTATRGLRSHRRYPQRSHMPQARPTGKRHSWTYAIPSVRLGNTKVPTGKRHLWTYAAPSDPSVSRSTPTREQSDKRHSWTYAARSVPVVLWIVDRLAALVGLCCTVHLLSVAHQMTKR